MEHYAVTISVFFIPLCRSVFPSAVIFLLPEVLPLFSLCGSAGEKFIQTLYV